MIQVGAKLLGHETDGLRLLQALTLLSKPIESSQKRAMRERLKRQYASAKFLVEAYRDAKPTSRGACGLERDAWEAGILMLEHCACLRKDVGKYIFLASPEECMAKLERVWGESKVLVDFGIAPTYLAH